MNRLNSALGRATVVVIATGLSVSPVIAQSRPSRSGSLATYEAGYGNGRQMESRPYGLESGSRNRLIVNGIIQSDGNSYSRSEGATPAQGNSGADFISTGADSASNTAIGNLLTVTVNGSWNTVIVDSRQTNSGNITANGASAPK
ncbi:holdfast anchoring protein HfaA [Brevundimonas subvibrioides]|uniref:holdfast anchoring protein HfaA n=1 Tax=Brevundimonas subvibrioides TaxID=74313 RepID=UPI0022B41AC8|nr:holdfast anchoring protein HfaA [Brevundimonas subvibrioides]